MDDQPPNKIWLFWRDFRWQPDAWQEAASHFVWAWRCAVKHPWLLWIPMVVTFASSLITSGLIVARFGHHPILHPGEATHAGREETVILFESFMRALNSYVITWPGVNISYAACLLIATYYTAYFFNIKQFRTFVFGGDAENRRLKLIHWIGFVSSAIPIFIAATVLSNGSFSISNQLVNDLVGALMVIPFWPFGIIFLTWVLRLFNSADEDRPRPLDRPIPFRIFANLLAVFAVQQAIMILHRQIVSEIMWHWGGLPYIVWHFAELLLILILLFLLFSDPYVVLKGRNALEGIQYSIRFLVANCAPFIQILVLSIPVLLGLEFANGLVSLQNSYPGSENIPYVRLIIWLIIVPLIQVLAQILVSLALFRFWQIRTSRESNPEFA